MDYEAVAKEFKTKGYAAIGDFLSPEQVERAKEEIRNYIDTLDFTQQPTSIFSTKPDSHESRDKYFMDSYDKVRFFFEEEAVSPETGEIIVAREHCINKIAHALHHRNEVFKTLTLDRRIGELALATGFKNPVCVQSMAILKPPKLGGAVLPHQDSSFLYNEPTKLIGFWVALEDADLDNSCMWFIPGSHRMPLSKRWVKASDGKMTFRQLTTDPVNLDTYGEYIPVPVKAGTLVMIDGGVVHKSEPNHDVKRSRWIYTFHCVEMCNSRYAAEENWLRPSEAFMPLNIPPAS